MRIPDNIEREHILKVVNELLVLGLESIPKKRSSTKYDLTYKNRRLPPKYVISLAHKYVDGTQLSSDFNGGAPTNNFLEARGFKIVDKSGKPWMFAVDPEDEAAVFEEGRKMFKLHVSRERDSKVAKLAKEIRWHKAGKFVCDVCGFDFRAFYGTRGYQYIEAHHTVAVSQLKKGQATKLKDIALVCSNCHRMLHKTRPHLSIAKLAVVIKHKANA
jgi:hypothetical protein